MLVLHLIFWVAFSLVVYSYVLYPVVVGFWAKLTKPPQTADICSREDWPFVSLIIAAYKEEKVIQERIDNALAFDYPADRYEVLIGCDGDLDRTGEIVRATSDPRIKLMQFPQRRGKPSVLNDCVPAAQGDLLAFSDANTFWNPDALKRLVRHYDDSKVGGVCGQLLLTDPETGANVDGVYWRYENFLKRCEGRIGALLGANGAIYSIRKELWQPIPANTIVDDFLIGMNIHVQGRKFLFDESAVANEESAPDMGAEFHRRARIGAGGFQSMAWLATLLNPLRGKVALAFWSHKVLRWFCPMFLTAMLLTNLALLPAPLYVATLIAQVAFYLVALLGKVLPGRGALGRLVKLPAMFTSMNAALLVGFVRWISNTQSGAWKRTARTSELEQDAMAPHAG